MKRLLIITASLLLATSAQALTETETKCNRAVEIAVTVHNAKKQGATEDQVIQVLREQGHTSGMVVWAAKLAMRTPANTSEWILRGAAFQECEELAKRGAI